MVGIGLMLKELRQKNGLTQEELADRCELTKGYISQLENDLTSPSIATLSDMLSALGTTMSEFFSPAVDEKVVFSSQDMSEKESESIKVTWLVPTAPVNVMEPILFELEPGAQSEKEVPHEGEEFGYILTGRIKLFVGGVESSAKAGDSFYFRSGKPHFIKNTGTVKAKIVWVSCPPSF